MKKRLFFSAIFFNLLFVVPLIAQNSDAGQENTGPSSLFNYFFLQPDDSVPVLRLETNWGLLSRNRLKEEYQPGTLSFQAPDGSTNVLEITLRARGNARKQVCYLPPIKIKASKKQLNQMGLNPEGKLKMVLPCEKGKAYFDCLLKEAMAYQLYEIIYPIHHRTKLVELKGWQNGKERHHFYAFLVEEEKEFAKRVGGKRIKQEKISTSSLDRDSYVKMCFFQYMIGNTDWSVGNSHNLQVLQLPEYDKGVPIPYDFDYSGFVGTNYAIPRSTLPIESVEERYFLGKYVTEEEAKECAAYFLSKKEEILQVCQSFEWIREKSNQAVQEFMAEFFDLLEDEEQVLKTFVTMKRRPQKGG